MYHYACYERASPVYIVNARVCSCVPRIAHEPLDRFRRFLDPQVRLRGGCVHTKVWVGGLKIKKAPSKKQPKMAHFGVFWGCQKMFLWFLLLPEFLPDLKNSFWK